MNTDYVSIYIKKDLKKKLLSIAEEQGKKPSAMVREWVEERIENIEKAEEQAKEEEILKKKEEELQKKIQEELLEILMEKLREMHSEISEKIPTKDEIHIAAKKEIMKQMEEIVPTLKLEIIKSLQKVAFIEVYDYVEKNAGKIMVKFVRPQIKDWVEEVLSENLEIVMKAKLAEEMLRE